MVDSRAKPLQSSKGISELKASHGEVEWQGRKSVRSFHIFVNETSEPVDLYWFHDGWEKLYGSIEPGSNLYVGTYTFNQWKVRSRATNSMLGVHCGQSATVTVRQSGCLIQFNSATADADDKDATTMDTPKGKYSIRAYAMGMPVWAFDSVQEGAVQRAVHVVSHMLQDCSPSVIETMQANKSAIAVFGRDHVVSDVPPHSFMRHNTDRNLDRTCRGLGGTTTVPVTSCGEENLLMDSDPLYACQSILVHEFGHAVQNLGLDLNTRAAVQAAYSAAVRQGLYPADCYMISNEQEYWATGTEAWFESTMRSDVNGCVNSRAAAYRIDPRLAFLLRQVYGDGTWRYHHDCPQPLSFKSQPAPQAAPQGDPESPASSQSLTCAQPAAGFTPAPSSMPSEEPAQPAASATATITNIQHAAAAGPLHVSGGEPCACPDSAPTPSSEAKLATRLSGGAAGGGGAGLKARLGAGTGTPAVIKVGPLITKPCRLASRSSAPPNSIAITASSKATAQPTVDVALCAPAPQKHSPLQHTQAPSQKSTEGQVREPWGKLHCHWSDPITTLCPGTRMYPSSEPAGVWSSTCSTVEPDSPQGMDFSPKSPAAPPPDHSAEVISILSGGALSGPADVAAVAGVQPAAPPPPAPSLGLLNAFTTCMAGRPDKVKNSV